VVRRLRWLVAILLVLTLAAATGAALMLQQKGIAPRALAPYVEQRAAGHNPAVVAAGRLIARTLVTLDRGAAALPASVPAAFGAQSAAAGAAAPGNAVLVASADDARRAFGAAMPGQVITFLPGRYRFTASVPQASRAGAEGAPIVVRAAQPGSVTIELDAGEGFLVSAPWWTFENLAIRGVCRLDADCEHAFHVVGQARHFVARNNTITDFNAHFKINGVGRQFPDNGRLEANTLTNAAPRRTANPVTPVDLVGASGWIIRRNFVADFIKAEGDRISYGAFAKGGGTDNLFEHNALVCELRLRGHPGQRVGLSLGGGGTGRAYCRDNRCITEQENSELRGNLVASCSDAGIYLNRAARSKIVHNSVIDTAGVQARYPETSAQFDGNLVDGAIHGSNDAVLRLGQNLVASGAYAYAGQHPVRARYRDPQALDFGWNAQAPRTLVSAPGLDLCGTARAQAPAYGAIESFVACLQPFKGAPPR